MRLSAGSPSLADAMFTTAAINARWLVLVPASLSLRLITTLGTSPVSQRPLECAVISLAASLCQLAMNSSLLSQMSKISNVVCDDFFWRLAILRKNCHNKIKISKNKNKLSWSTPYNTSVLILLLIHQMSVLCHILAISSDILEFSTDLCKHHAF